MLKDNARVGATNGNLESEALDHQAIPCNQLRKQYALERIIPHILGMFWRHGEANDCWGCYLPPVFLDNGGRLEVSANEREFDTEVSIEFKEHAGIPSEVFAHFWLSPERDACDLYVFKRGDWEDNLLEIDAQPRTLKQLQDEGLMPKPVKAAA